MKGKTKAKLAIVVILLFGVLAWALVPGSLKLLSTAGYPTAYEGAKATYYGIGYNNLQYTNAQKQQASLLRFDTQLKFDPDAYDAWQCNLAGEMTSVFIPSQNLPADWVPRTWWDPTRDWKNPYNVYEWQVPNADGTVSFYRMEEWRTVWYFSVSAEWDSGPDWIRQDDEAQNRRYYNTELWFEFDVSPTWYFSGVNSTYFSIAKIELMNIETRSKQLQSDGSWAYSSPAGVFRVLPESVGSILYVYNTLLIARVHRTRTH